MRCKKKNIVNSSGAKSSAKASFSASMYAVNPVAQVYPYGVNPGTQPSKGSNEKEPFIANLWILGIFDLIDGIFGWMPIIGDIGGLVLNLILPVYSLATGKIRIKAFIEMLMVVAIDSVIGFFPVAGDIVDLFWTANIINRKILISEIKAKSEKRGRESRSTLIIGIVFLLTVLLGFTYFTAPQLAEYGGPFGNIMSAVSSVPTNIVAWFQEHNPVEMIRNYYKRQIYAATGDYYTGKVDQNAQAKLGVYLEDIKQADPTFYTDRAVSMFATLVVQTLDEPVTVKISCETDNPEGEQADPQIRPRDTFDVDIFEEREIDCMFEPGAIKKGVSIFTIGAEFDFKTMSYVKSYFMDMERIRTLRRDGLDPLEQYGVQDKEPSAIYTNGPMGIGMGIGKPPVGIDFELDYDIYTLGITLENKWEGKMTGINRFVLLVPKGFSLDGIGAPFVQIECGELETEELELCSDAANNVYLIEDPTIGEIGRNDFKSYRAYLRVNRDDYNKVLDEISPVSTRYFKAIIDYSYKLEKTKTINIESRNKKSLVEGETTDITAPQAGDIIIERKDSGEVVISWTTDEESNDIFEWWSASRAPPVYPSTATPNEAGFSTEHQRVISGISTGAGYGYTIESVDIAGNSNKITRSFTGP